MFQLHDPSVLKKKVFIFDSQSRNSQNWYPSNHFLWPKRMYNILDYTYRHHSGQQSKKE